MKAEAPATMTLDGEVTEDGRLLVSLPPDTPRGRVRITVELASGAPEVTDEELRGLGLTAEEISRSPDFGAWGQQGGVEDSAEFVADLRADRLRYRW
jgi:hypothetical protein